MAVSTDPKPVPVDDRRRCRRGATRSSRRCGRACSASPAARPSGRDPLGRGDFGGLALIGPGRRCGGLGGRGAHAAAARTAAEDRRHRRLRRFGRRRRPRRSAHGGRLQLWTLLPRPDRGLAGEAPGYAAGRRRRRSRRHGPAGGRARARPARGRTARRSPWSRRRVRCTSACAIAAPGPRRDRHRGARRGRGGAAAGRPRRRPGGGRRARWGQAVTADGRGDSRLFPARPFVGASIAVIRDDRVLLAARANEPMRGVWTLPGGLVEAGEALAEAALRELSEEVGLTAEVVGVLSPTEIIDPGRGRPRPAPLRRPSARRRSGAAASRWPAPKPSAPGGRRSPRSPTLPTTPGLVETLQEAFARVRDRDPARDGTVTA